MLSPFLFLTTLLAVDGTFASPTAPLEERWADVPWIGYYKDGNMECTGSNHTYLWLDVIDGLVEDFKRPANTAVGVHYGRGSVSATSILTYTDKGEAHNFTDNVDSNIECYNNVSDWAWSVPWSTVTAFGDSPPEDEDDSWSPVW